jgi:AmiR/NasT family two-component response regulator
MRSSGSNTAVSPPLNPAAAQQIRCIPVVLASANPVDRSFFASALSGTHYFAVPVGNLSEASTLLAHFIAPVILYDQSFDALDWRTALVRLAGARKPPSALVLTDAAIVDHEAEVYPGAVYFLMRPLDSENVLAALNLAYVRWTLGITPDRGLK